MNRTSIDAGRPTSSRRTFLKRQLAGWTALSLAGGAWPAAADDEPQGDWFTLVALPDTQFYSESHPDVFTSQTQWIVDHKDERKIAFVVHEGDITNRNNQEQWENADRSLSLLDRQVPYCLAVGNHDMGPGGSARNRDLELFNRFFPTSRLESSPSFQGTFDKGSENSYHTFTALGDDYLVVGLEFGPRDEVLEWASRIVTEHPSHRAIVVTHCYMYFDDTRMGPGDQWSPHGYGCGGNDGEQIWEKFASRHANLLLVLSGHVLDDGLGRLTSEAPAGNPVHQVLANYQMKPQGGEGWLRLMQFAPGEKKIYVRTYSPWLDRYAEDPDNQFILDLPA